MQINLKGKIILDLSQKNHISSDFLAYCISKFGRAKK